MPSEIQIPSFVTTALQLLLAFGGAFLIALWVGLIVWTFRDMRSRSRDVFAIILATLMVLIFGPLGLLIYFLLRPPVTLAELYERSLEEEALLQDLEERPRCPGCSRQVRDEWILCPDCHTTLKKICPNCQNGLHMNWNVCPFCGTHVATLSADNHGNHGGPVMAPEVSVVPEVFVGREVEVPVAPKWSEATERPEVTEVAFTPEAPVAREVPVETHPVSIERPTQPPEPLAPPQVNRETVPFTPPPDPDRQ